eukprot:6508320-Alexandrium_andersonii.AAC.1
MAFRRSRAMQRAKFGLELDPDGRDELRRAAEEQWAAACLASPQHRQQPGQPQQQQQQRQQQRVRAQNAIIAEP